VVIQHAQQFIGVFHRYYLQYGVRFLSEGLGEEELLILVIDMQDNELVTRGKDSFGQYE